MSSKGGVGSGEVSIYDPGVSQGFLDQLQSEQGTGASDVVLFVDAVSGDDSRSGLSAATALRSFDVAIGKLPRSWVGKCRVNLASGSYSSALSELLFDGPVGGLAEPLMIIGPLIDSGLGTLIDTGGSTTTVINAGAGMVVNAHFGMRLRVLTGARAGQTRTIVSNTATSFTLNNPLTGGATALGDTMIVETQGASLTLGATMTWISKGQASKAGVVFGFAFYAIEFVHPSNRRIQITGGDTVAQFDTCEFNLSGGTSSHVITAFGAQLRLSTLIFSFPDVSNSSSGTACSIKGGVANSTLSGLLITNGGRGGTMTVVMDTAGVFISGNAQGGFFSSPWIIRGGIVVEINSFALISNGTIDGGAVQTTLLRVLSGSVVTSLSAVLQNALGDAIFVDRADLLGGTTVTGAGNVGFGVHLAAMASGVFTAAATVTGTAGDIEVGATVSTHANLTAATFVTDANFLSRISRT